jgi:hypothetical protein
MAMAQVTDNPAMADGSSIHQEAKQQLHELSPYQHSAPYANWETAGVEGYSASCYYQET